jgi:hypothetical protein
MSRRPDAQPLQSIRIQLSPNPVVTAAFVVIVALALAHAVQNVLVHHVGIERGRHFLSLFDGDAEQSFTNWVSTMLLAVLGVCLLWVSSIAQDLKKSWQVLGILVLAISCDEVAGVHERTGILYRTLKSMGIQLNDMFYFGWTLPVLVVLPVAAILFYRFVSALPSRHRQRLSLSAIVYLTGAVGMELWESRVAAASSTDQALFHWITLVEEFLEMTGVLLGIRTVLLLLEELNAEAIVRIASENPPAAVNLSPVPPKQRAATASASTSN